MSALALNRFVFAFMALTLISTSLYSPSAHAERDPAGWVGGMFGLSVPNADNSSARPIYGITGGAKLGTEWGLGAYYLTSKNNEDFAGIERKFDYELYGIEFAYHFEGEARGVYVGGRLGTSKLSRGTAFGTASTSPFHWGVVGGYNHFLGDHFSIGGDVSFISMASSNDSPAAGVPAVETDAFTMLNFIATAKFWF